MISILRKEIAQFFSSLTGYIITTVFVVVTGLFLWVIPGDWNIPISGYANMDGLFDLAPWLFLFLIPAVTMGSFSEEYQSGTAELLLTRPISEWSIVLGKYLASLIIVTFSIVLTLVYYLTLYQMASPVGNIDHSSIFGSYIALFFLGGTYISVGLFASTLNTNQAVAFIYALVFSYLLFAGFELLGQIPFLTTFGSIFEQLGISVHYDTFSKGLIEIGDVVYYLSIIIFFLFLTTSQIKRKR